MALPQRKTPNFSADDFLAWDATQTERSEFIAGEVFAMAGGEDRNATTALNLTVILRSHLRGTPCRPYMADVKLRIEAADAFFYPDVFVTCSARDAEQRLIKHDAVLVAEVLSPSTAAWDMGGKFAAYRLLPTLREYLLIDVDRRAIDLFRRREDGLWVLHPLHRGDRLRLESVEFDGAVDAVFEDLEDEPGPSSAAPPTHTAAAAPTVASASGAGGG
jgi:Uma2 family endonuclease